MYINLTLFKLQCGLQLLLIKAQVLDCLDEKKGMEENLAIEFWKNNSCKKWSEKKNRNFLELNCFMECYPEFTKILAGACIKRKKRLYEEWINNIKGLPVLFPVNISGSFSCIQRNQTRAIHWYTVDLIVYMKLHG